jgi:hypothetical protein
VRKNSPSAVPDIGIGEKQVQRLYYKWCSRIAPGMLW